MRGGLFGFSCAATVDVAQNAVFGGRFTVQHLFNSNRQSFYKTTCRETLGNCWPPFMKHGLYARARVCVVCVVALVFVPSAAHWGGFRPVIWS